jgi:hypothetical protein
VGNLHLRFEEGRLGNSSLSLALLVYVPDVDAQFEEFSGKARSSPEWFIQAPAADLFPSQLGHRRPAGAAVANLPTPEGPKPFRCQAIPVSGWTIPKVEHQPDKPGTAKPGASDSAELSFARSSAGERRVGGAQGEDRRRKVNSHFIN